MALIEPGKSGFEALLKPRYEAVYKDKACQNTKSFVYLQAWQKLSQVLEETYKNGPRFCRFLASLSFPAPPEGAVLSANDKIEHAKVFAKKLASAIIDVQMMDPIAFVNEE